MNKIHPFHKYGDIKLVSREGVILMANSNRLSDVSTKMAHCVNQAPMNDPKNSVVKRQDNWRSETLSLFLDMVNVAKPRKPRKPKADLLSLCQLFYLCCEFYLDNHLQKLVEASMLQQATEYNQQWALLTIPHQWKFDWDTRDHLANNALKNMTTEAFRNPVIYIDKLDHFEQAPLGDALDLLPSNWRAQLLQIFISVDKLKDDTDKRAAVSYWENIANKFNPERF